MTETISGRRAPQPAEPLDRDRKFRPDVEGLRAVAVGTVVLYHAHIPGLRGGFVGVDIFFVISGFVISRLLLEQVERKGRPQFAEFYARRARRILPAGGFVAIVSVLFAYRYLGFVSGNFIADDLRWIAVFLGNLHFSNVGTNYFQSRLPPSTLQNYWSLAVEEQFYVIYPALILLLTFAGPRAAVKRRIVAVVSVIAVASFIWSVSYTTRNPGAAYFALSTRAWELAVGGILAASTATWSRISERAATWLGWTGMALIAISVAVISGSMLFPGWVAILPVAGSALVILSGIRAPRGGPEVLLGTAPFRWIGKLSFSIYLWHWPIFITAEEHYGRSLPYYARFGLIAATLGASVVSFYGLEDPVRRNAILARSPARSLQLGAAIIVTMLVVGTVQIHSHLG